MSLSSALVVLTNLMKENGPVIHALLATTVIGKTKAVQYSKLNTACYWLPVSLVLKCSCDCKKKNKLKAKRAHFVTTLTRKLHFVLSMYFLSKVPRVKAKKRKQIYEEYKLEYTHKK